MGIKAIIYTATNSATISGSGFPPSVNGAASGSSYTISGSPSSTGTYGYSVTATTAAGCTSAAAAAGTITVYPPTPPRAASTKTWIYAGLAWSDRISNMSLMGCTSVMEFSTTEYTLAEYYGSHCSWSCVNVAKNTMCPDSWRVPTLADFEALIASGPGRETLASEWGVTGDYRGNVYMNTSYGVYWSSTENELYSTTYAYDFYYNNNSASPYIMTNSAEKYRGAAVRCVRDL
jgi:hypothetical protein